MSEPWGLVICPGICSCQEEVLDVSINTIFVNRMVRHIFINRARVSKYETLLMENYSNKYRSLHKIINIKQYTKCQQKLQNQK